MNGSVNFSTSASGRATTVNGTIRRRAGTRRLDDTLEFSTVNGSINLRCPGPQHGREGPDRERRHLDRLSATVTGRISRRRLEGTIGGGGRTLSLETVNGGISLKRLEIRDDR